MPVGAVGVYSSMERPKKKEPKVTSRLVPCSNGHGVIGQVFVAVTEEWFGACEVCGEQPEEGTK
jgi:hypothetical protein